MKEGRNILSRFSARSVNPNRVASYISQNQKFRETSDDVLAALPPSLMLEFISNTGRLKKKKMGRFLRSIDSLLGEFTLMDLIKMSPECIRNDGSISVGELKDILQGARDD